MHPDSAAAANALAHAGVTGLGGQPLPEAVVFGVMGDLLHDIHNTQVRAIAALAAARDRVA
ncbi:MAG TPA: hypothetical protein VK923_13245 [Euzebyales bacterium]|nr:hypothetical protein [Euzebyales bacterium]